MSDQTFCKGDTVCLKRDYQDEGRNFKEGDRGKVGRHDAILVRIRMPREYEICVRPALLKRIN